MARQLYHVNGVPPRDVIEGYSDDTIGNALLFASDANDLDAIGQMDAILKIVTSDVPNGSRQRPSPSGSFHCSLSSSTRAPGSS